MKPTTSEMYSSNLKVITHKPQLDVNGNAKSVSDFTYDRKYSRE